MNYPTSSEGEPLNPSLILVDFCRSEDGIGTPYIFSYKKKFEYKSESYTIVNLNDLKWRQLIPFDRSTVGQELSFIRWFHPFDHTKLFHHRANKKTTNEIREAKENKKSRPLSRKTGLYGNAHVTFLRQHQYQLWHFRSWTKSVSLIQFLITSPTQYGPFVLIIGVNKFIGFNIIQFISSPRNDNARIFGNLIFSFNTRWRYFLQFVIRKLVLLVTVKYVAVVIIDL